MRELMLRASKHPSPLPRTYLQKPKKYIRADSTLMRFIQHDDGVALQPRVYESLTEQETIGHVLDDGVGRCAVLKSNGVPDLRERIQ